MKKIAWILFFLLSVGMSTSRARAAGLPINEENFPAEWLRNTLATKYYDKDGDGVLSQTEIREITVLTVMVDNRSDRLTWDHYIHIRDDIFIEAMEAMDYEVHLVDSNFGDKTNIARTWLERDRIDTAGLEHLTSCKSLKLNRVMCQEFSITSCPPSLTKIDMGGSMIGTMKVAGEKIQTIHFPYVHEWFRDEYPCMVDKLDITGCPELTTLECDSPTLRTVSVDRNRKLRDLICRKGKLKKLNLKKNTKLVNLDLSDQSLKKLDISKLKGLVTLDVRNNSLTRLDVTHNKKLTQMSCAHNQLKRLDLSQNKKLTWIACQENQITELCLPDAHCVCNASEMYDEDAENGDTYYSMFYQNKLRTLDIRPVKNFRRLTKREVMKFLNGYHCFLEDIIGFEPPESGTPYLRPIKRLVIGKQLQGKDLKWVRKQAKECGVKIICK